MNEDQPQVEASASSNGKHKFDWTFGCEGCQDRKAFLVQNKNDIIFLALVLAGLFAVTRIKLT